MEESNIKAMREALEIAEYLLCAKGLFDVSKQMTAALSAIREEWGEMNSKQSVTNCNRFCNASKMRSSLGADAV